MSKNEISEKSSDLTYHKKDAYIDMSLYNIVLNAINKLYTSYNPTLQKMHEPVVGDNYKVTVDTRVILIVEHEDDKIHWACITSISTDSE